VFDSLPAIHDEIRARAFFGIRHLPRQQRLKPFCGNPAFQHAGALHLGWRRHHDRGIDTAVAAGLEQQRNIEHDNLGAGGLSVPQELLLGAPHQRMHDGLEPLQRRRIAHHLSAERHAIDLAAPGRAGKRRLDQRRGFALVKPMDRGVGVVHRHALLGE